MFQRLFIQKCRYHEVCELYESDAFTCNTYHAEGEYCGCYKRLAKTEMRKAGSPKIL